MTKSKYDIIFLQCGVGSWAASCIWYYMQEFKNNRPKIVLIEPDEACGVYESFANGKRSSPGTTFNTIMAGLNCGIPSKSAWKIIQQGCDAVLKISDTGCLSFEKTKGSPLSIDNIRSSEYGICPKNGTSRRWLSLSPPPSLKR